MASSQTCQCFFAKSSWLFERRPYSAPLQCGSAIWNSYWVMCWFRQARAPWSHAWHLSLMEEGLGRITMRALFGSWGWPACSIIRGAGLITIGGSNGFCACNHPGYNSGGGGILVYILVGRTEANVLPGNVAACLAASPLFIISWWWVGRMNGRAHSQINQWRWRSYLIHNHRSYLFHFTWSRMNYNRIRRRRTRLRLTLEYSPMLESLLQLEKYRVPVA